MDGRNAGTRLCHGEMGHRSSIANSTDQEVETAINNGEIIRTHVLRPTWHFVSADDVYWMLELTAPQIKASLRSRHKQLGLSETIFTKSNTIMGNALTGGKNLTREELLAELGKAKITLNENRASHLLLRAELDGIMCSGPIKEENRPMLCLKNGFRKRKPLIRKKQWPSLPKNISPAMDLPRYRILHGGRAYRLAKQNMHWKWQGEILFRTTINSRTYWFTSYNFNPRIDPEVVYLLPAYDEFLISYEDRSASLPYEDFNKTVSTNGIFRPIIVIKGQVAGIWKRMVKKDKVIIETELFKQIDKPLQDLIEKAFIQYGHFLNKRMEISQK